MYKMMHLLHEHRANHRDEIYIAKKSSIDLAIAASFIISLQIADVQCK